MSKNPTQIMKNDTTIIIEKQIYLLGMELDIELQRTKIKEYSVRSEVLLARVKVEEHKLGRMENEKSKISN